MNTSDAVTLISGALRHRGGTWADVGAGDGTFTRALAELLGPESRIYAIDRDAGAIATLARWALTDAPNVIPVTADFTRHLSLPGMEEDGLDGMLLANVLHFVRDTGPVLTRLTELVRPGGHIVIVEYDRRRASPWVPHPVPSVKLPVLAEAAGLSTPTIINTRPSLYGGTLYVAVAERLPERERLQQFSS
ncbi:MAG TPA: class I SAM-dependent methyltransferase [Gemmatimonadaceae bacterium]|nr:class I SAM-dependent methyltransferase [Gemmatimonadaceae bacterium]